jgi:hypothetical protein
MAAKHRVTMSVTLELDEIEARALCVFVEYGTESFLQAFYTKLGQHYLRPHEAGVRTLFEKIKTEIGPAVSACDRAIKALADSENKEKNQ